MGASRVDGPPRAQQGRPLDAATSALTDSQDRSSLRSVADDLDVVAVEIEDERAIVVRMVLRPQARPTVVATAHPQRRLVEGAHLSPVLNREGDAHGRRAPAVAADPQRRLAALAEAQAPHL